MKLPAFLDARRLEGRIVRLFLLLLLVVQTASFLLVQRAIENQAINAIDQRLKSAAVILRDVLSRRLAVEYIKSTVLTKDFGFIEAVGLLHSDEAGPATLIDALDNQAQRSRARLAAFVDLQQQLYASEALAPKAVAAAMALPEGEAKDAELRLALVDGEPLQLLRVPARAPGPIGQVVFAYAIHPELLVPIKQYSNVDVALGARNAQGQWRHTVHAENPDGLAELLRSASMMAPQGDAARNLEWQGHALRGRLIDLPALGNSESLRLSALLWASLDEEMAQPRALQLRLLFLNLAGIALFALGSVFTARRLSGPIQSLRRFAERLGAGDYDSPVQTRTNLAEVAGLARAFEAMRLGIRKHKAEIENYAYWDRLTGLPNRAKFIARVREHLSAEKPLPLALLVLNLDRFKPVNDALGRELGDRLLQQVALRLQPALGPGGPELNLLARLGGDEFAICLHGADAEKALIVAQQILQALVEPLHLERRSASRDADRPQDTLTVDVSASIGIALAPDHGSEPDDLITLAERAMDLAKRRQAGVLVFEPSMDARSPASLGLLSELRRAVDEDELRLFLQPKQDLRTQQVHAAEALVRWQHPQRGMVPPGAFIPFAEETGFVRQLTQWVLRAASRHAAEARRQGLPLRISVNLSTRDLLDAELLVKIQTILRDEACEPDWLCLEITESAIMDDPQRALATARALSSAGFRLSIDDFGTGYSSLAYLKQLPVQELKIDQSFVFGMVEDEGDRTIVRSTIELAHNLGLAVVAEGIETEAALTLLAQWGCDEGQGYFIARPMPAEQLLAQLQKARQG
jgi:diguanylate cyclase (GGDEF)-like protein